MSAATPWWGEIELDVGQTKGWHLGPLEFCLTRNDSDWRLFHQRNREPESGRFQAGFSECAVPDTASQLRFQFRQSPASISVTPVLADRPFVIKTDAPLRLPKGEKIVFYMTTIMRLAFRHGAAELLEIPVYDLQDTWFGNFTNGELCYAGTTLARTHFDQVPVRPYRPVTPVTLINRSRSTLSLEKFKLPVPFLNLHTTSEGRLFTDGIDLVVDDEDQQVEVRLSRKSDGNLIAAGLVSRARLKMDFRERLALEGFLGR